MSNVPPAYNEEIDLLTLIQTVWDGKWKIGLIMVISLLALLGFNIVKSDKTFIAITEIKPITSFELDKYSLFNSSIKIVKEKTKQDTEGNEFGVFEITRESLLNLYIEKIEEGSLLETGIKKYNLINKEDFDSEYEYREAVEKFASKIEVIKPVEEENKSRLHNVLRAEYDNKDKWKKLLSYLNIEANKSVKNTLVNRFKTTVLVQNQKKNFAIKDLNILMDNAMKDYERNTQEYLAFLSEQASIARKLGVKKNTIESQKFITQNSFVTSIKTDTPLYLRGCQAIEEEIKLIKHRDNKKAFMKNLYKLEQKKRTLEQDNTIKRAEDLLELTPLGQNGFKASIVKVAATDFIINSKKKLYYILVTILSGIIGVIYVLIANAVRNRKYNTVNS